MQLAQDALTCFIQLGLKRSAVQGLQLGGLLRGDRPDQRGFMAMGTAQGQERQNFQAAVGLTKPLQGLLPVRCAAAHPRGQRMLVVGQNVKVDAQGLTGAAGTALANHGQRCRGMCLQKCDSLLGLHPLRQQALQLRHIDDPGQALSTGGVEMDKTTFVTPDPHVHHGGGMGLIRPGVQILQHLA